MSGLGIPLVCVAFALCLVSSCPDYWAEFKGSCYAYIQDLSSWAGAAEKCREMHSSLVSVESQEENEFLKSLVRKHHPAKDVIVWLGGNDFLNESNWLWESGEPMTFTDWTVGQPDNAFFQENCLSLRPDYNYHWNDAPCSKLYYFFCEMDLCDSLTSRSM